MRVMLPLPNDLVEDDGAGHRGVEGVDLTLHGYRYEEITFPLYQRPQPSAFPADDHGQGDRQILMKEISMSLGSSADHPYTVLFNFFEGGRDIGDTDHGEVKDRPGRALCHGRGDAGCPVLGDDHPPDAAGVGSTDESPQISGVFNPIEDQEKGYALAWPENCVKIGIVTLINETYHPLMGGVCSKGVQF